MMATGLPQYRPAAGGVLAGAAPALLPDPADDRFPGRGPVEGGRAPAAAGTPATASAPDRTRTPSSPPATP